MANTPFKMKGSPMQRNFGLGPSPAKQPKSKILKLLKVLKTGVSLTPQGIVGLGLWEAGEHAVKSMSSAWSKAENIPYTEKYAKYWEQKHGGSKTKKKEIQIKKGKIKATTLDY